MSFDVNFLPLSSIDPQQGTKAVSLFEAWRQVLMEKLAVHDGEEFWAHNSGPRTVDLTPLRQEVTNIGEALMLATKVADTALQLQSLAYARTLAAGAGKPGFGTFEESKPPVARRLWVIEKNMRTAAFAVRDICRSGWGPARETAVSICFAQLENALEAIKRIA